MKKILFAILFLTMMSIQSVKAQSSIVALHHEGNVTLYSSTQLQTALDAAVEGDTLYLSEGTFSGDVKLVKSNICISGAGKNTILAGNLWLGESTTASIENNTLEGLNILGSNVWVYSLKNCKMSQCQFNTMRSGSSEGYTTELLISNCFCKEELTMQGMIGIAAFNSKFVKLSKRAGAAGGASFTNCNIGTIPFESGDNYGNDNTRIFTNCIINDWGTKATCVNCYLRTSEAAGSLTDCYVSTTAALDDNMDCVLDNLSDYVGNDGKVVGITVGDNPYTLTPSVPHVSAHSIEVDAVNQKLNVTLTIEN